MQRIEIVLEIASPHPPAIILPLSSRTGHQNKAAPRKTGEIIKGKRNVRIGIAHLASDLTQRKQHEEHQRVLLAELDRRLAELGK